MTNGVTCCGDGKDFEAHRLDLTTFFKPKSGKEKWSNVSDMLVIQKRCRPILYSTNLSVVCSTNNNAKP